MSEPNLTPWSRLSASDVHPPPAHEIRSVVVIGAGSSGLVAAKHLRDAGFVVEVLEKDAEIGGAGRHLRRERGARRDGRARRRRERVREWRKRESEHPWW